MKGQVTRHQDSKSRDFGCCCFPELCLLLMPPTPQSTLPFPHLSLCNTLLLTCKQLMTFKMNLAHALLGHMIIMVIIIAYFLHSGDMMYFSRELNPMAIYCQRGQPNPHAKRE